jgi:hypothetical protein
LVQKGSQRALQKLLYSYKQNGSLLYEVGYIHQFCAQERGSIGRYCSRYRRRKTREESLDAARPIQLPNHAANRRVARHTLQPRLYRVHGKNWKPHGNARRCTSSHDRRKTQFPWQPRLRILWRQRPLDCLVGGKVRSAASRSRAYVMSVPR